MGMAEIKHSTDLIFYHFFAEEQTEERSEQINTEGNGLKSMKPAFMEKQVMLLFFLEDSPI